MCNQSHSALSVSQEDERGSDLWSDLNISLLYKSEWSSAETRGEVNFLLDGWVPPCGWQIVPTGREIMFRRQKTRGDEEENRMFQLSKWSGAEWWGSHPAPQFVQSEGLIQFICSGEEIQIVFELFLLTKHDWESEDDDDGGEVVFDWQVSQVKKTERSDWTTAERQDSRS